MGTVLLARHGQSEANVGEPQLCGVRDVPLTEKGQVQSQKLAQRLAGKAVTVVYASDLCRSSEMAQIVADECGVQVFVDPCLREVNYGEWEGQASRDLAERFPELWRCRLEEPWRFCAPGGERFTECQDRIAMTFSKITRNHGAETILIVGHHMVNRLLLCHLSGMPMSRYRDYHQDNGCLNILKLENERVVLSSVNDTCHLKVE